MSIPRKDKHGNPRPTLKQRLFAEEYARTGNGTKSALKVYEVKSDKVAGAISTENLKKPVVSSYIEQILQKARYNPVNSVTSVMGIEKKAAEHKSTYGHSLKASELLLKLSSTLIEKSQNTNLNLNIDSMEPHDLLILKKKYDKLLEG